VLQTVRVIDCYIARLLTRSLLFFDFFSTAAVGHNDGASALEGQLKDPPVLQGQPNTASTTANAGLSAFVNGLFPAGASSPSVFSRVTGSEEWNGDCDVSAEQRREVQRCWEETSLLLSEGDDGSTLKGTTTARDETSRRTGDVTEEQPAAAAATPVNGSAGASEPHKIWALILHLDFKNTRPKAMRNLGRKNRLSNPKTFTVHHELTDAAGWRGSESSAWSIYWYSNKPYYRSPDGDVYRSLVDCRRAHYQKQLHQAAIAEKVFNVDVDSDEAAVFDSPGGLFEGLPESEGEEV
jgi:hypothetical protein